MKKNARCGSGHGSRAKALHRRVFSFSDRLRVSRFVSEAFATEALQRDLSAAGIVYAKSLAVAVAEIELGQIAMQVSLAHVEVAAGDTALEDAEIVLNSVGVRIGECPAYC